MQVQNALKGQRRFKMAGQGLCTTPTLRRFVTHVSDLVVLGEAVVVEDGEPQRLVEGVRVG